MKRIKLTQGKFALVDDEDFEWLNHQKWYFNINGYAARHGGKKKIIFMHRQILETPSGMITDHINRNRIDNRKGNLRIADKRINSINRGLQKNNTSGYKGISWTKNIKKWEAYIWNYQKKILLGYFVNLQDAVLIRKQAENKYHAI